MIYTAMRVLLPAGAACVFATALHAQAPDSLRADSVARSVFAAPRDTPFAIPPFAPLERTIDGVLTGGAGYYLQGATAPLQATANVDFFARTNALDLTAGFHLGFSKPATEGLSLGLRFPIAERGPTHGFYGDAALLVLDHGSDSEGFQTGLRGALAVRSGMLECRLAGELRRVPFTGGQFEAWGGVELGLVFNLLHDGLHLPTRKDTVLAAIKYIATAQQLEDLQSRADPDLDAWLDRFWNERNVTGSARNETRLEFERRIRKANDLYGTENYMGVATDQGRVLLLYGEPDRIENGFSTISPDQKYQLWVVEGRLRGYQTAIFLFVSLQGGRYLAYNPGSGTYQDVYSTVRGGYREVFSNVRGEYSEGIPSDLPPAMMNFVQSSR